MFFIRLGTGASILIKPRLLGDACAPSQPALEMDILVCLLIISDVINGFVPSIVPQYCAPDIVQRTIPELTTSQQSRVLELLQVQSITRHGSRVPWGKFMCWKNYDLRWDNCNVNEVNRPSCSSVPTSGAFYRKVYDGSMNVLGGSCILGQLLEDGFKQESQLGVILKNSYFFNKHPHLNLFTSNDWDRIDNSKVYIRSSNDASGRTVLSGELVWSSLFDFSTSPNAVVDLHSGDFSTDNIYANSGACPRILDISSSAYASSEFQAKNTSAQSQQLVQQLNAVFGEGAWQWSTFVDCTMTAICTGKSMPDGAANEMTDELFEAALAHSEWIYAYQALYNNAAYSKLAMAALLSEIRAKMTAAMTTETGNDLKKFVLYSGHDSTIMPVLAALLGSDWDGLWSGYASMLNFELYRGHGDGEYLFRLVYDTKVVQLPGCTAADLGLCDVKTFLAATAFLDDAASTDCSRVSLPTSSSSSSSSSSFLSAEQRLLSAQPQQAEHTFTATAGDMGFVGHATFTVTASTTSVLMSYWGVALLVLGSGVAGFLLNTLLVDTKI